MNRTGKIISIIEKRRPLAEKIAGVENNLKKLASAFGQLEAHRLELVSSKVDAIGLDNLNFSTIRAKIDEETIKLETLKKRFSRPTLNIGVVGLMGQGKSTLLKSLSGLTDNEIPALEGGACTIGLTTNRILGYGANYRLFIKHQIVLVRLHPTYSYTFAIR